MINKFKKIFFRKKELINTNESTKDKFLRLGFLKVGKNSNILKLTIENETGLDFLDHPIIIGDNCLIMGALVIHSKNSKIEIGNNVFIGPNSALFCREKITIGSNVMISWGCTLIDTNAHSLISYERESDVQDWIKGPESKNWNNVLTNPIIINEKCWIGFNTVIIKGVIIGEGAVVGCASVVTKNVDKYTIVGGNPAVKIKNTN
jgi:acetyltransferase-like isoleucine patch superfamily enzyme